ncbi:hypothetical protein ROHU_027466 [Labeo rohita]|uniref:Uncharacterized protein n=1 Tax=Labeo rohita TaxID=84645 RepID=A0A498MGQ5_LABRO|nr:hypothetical protein ROHU_027466 [Labeo rohita]
MVPDDRLQTHSVVSTDMTSRSAGVMGSEKLLQSTLNENPPLISTSPMKMPFWTVSHCHLQTMAPPFGPVAFITCQNWLEGRRVLGPHPILCHVPVQGFEVNVQFLQFYLPRGLVEKCRTQMCRLRRLVKDEYGRICPTAFGKELHHSQKHICYVQDHIAYTFYIISAGRSAVLESAEVQQENEESSALMLDPATIPSHNSRLAPCQNVPSALHFHLHTGSVMPETPVRGKFWEVSGDSEVKEPERGGVGWFRVCAPVRSSPGGRKALCRVDFLPAGNPAHSLHPPPLTSRADAVRAEFRKPRVPYAGGVAYKQDPARGRSAW